MKEIMTKKLQRLERKKRKTQALLEIIKLNDKDRKAKLQALDTKLDQALRSEDGGEDTRARNTTSNMPLQAISERELTTMIPKRNSAICQEDEEDSDTADKSELQTNKKPKLSDEEYANLKQVLRERKKRLKIIPKLTLRAGGENAVLDTKNMQKRIPIFLSDVQHLLLFSLLGHHSPYLPTRWCKLEKYNKISHTVVLMIEGLSLYHFIAHESVFTHITNNLAYHLEMVTPAIYGASITQELAAVPLTGTQSCKLIKQYGSLETALQTTGDVIRLLKTVFPVHSVHTSSSEENASKNLPPTDKFCRTKLLLSLWQMVEENYPVPLKGALADKYGSYILTKDYYEEATSTSPMFALDCEMCKTTSGDLELARISVVDESMNIIYESLVKPENPITNYLTQYSGITKEMLDDVTVRLQDVQNTLKTILPRDAILVGQSLNSDLHTLKMIHPYIIDTSVIYNITGDRYRKTKLQILTREFLGEIIQDSKDGHCSTEDSKASMKLVQLKLANSVNYGDAVLLGDNNIEILKMQAERMSRRELQKIETKKYATSIFKHLTKENKTAAIVGDEEIMSEYAKYLKSSSLNVMKDESFTKNDKVRLVITDDNHAVDRTSEIAFEHGFILCHLRIREEQLIDEHMEKTFRTVNKWVKKLWQATAVNGLFCVLFGGQNNAGNGACFLNIKKETSAII